MTESSPGQKSGNGGMASDYKPLYFESESLEGGACTDKDTISALAKKGILATDLSEGNATKQKIAATEFCNTRCPIEVKHKCLDIGLVNKQPGIYGGKGPTERRRMAQQREKPQGRQ